MAAQTMKFVTLQNGMSWYFKEEAEFAVDEHNLTVHYGTDELPGLYRTIPIRNNIASWGSSVFVVPPTEEEAKLQADLGFDDGMGL